MVTFRRKDTAPAQNGLWLRPEEIVTGPHNAFCTKPAALLEKVGFMETVYRICAPYYRLERREGGRPPVDPAVLMWMRIVGFPEGIGSARGIASRCADRLAIRRFLGYSLAEETPDHSTFTVFRHRLPVEAFEALHAEVLRSRREQGLVRGRRLGIDSSVIGANASLSGLERRNSEESHREYVRWLAADAGVAISDPAAVARFDRTRADRRTSNREWHHPDDPDARVGRAKPDACDMICKPEHIVVLESGVVISAEIRHGDEGDTAGLADRAAEAAGKVEAIHGEEHDAGSSCVLELAADKGYDDGFEPALIRHETGMRTAIPDPSRGRRRMDKLEKGVRSAVRAAGRAVATKSGKALLRARGTHLERGFAHELECGGLRRTYLRGRENIARRYRCGIIAFNFTLLMRKLFGTGTPRQMAAAGRAFCALLRKPMAMAHGLRTASHRAEAAIR